MELLSSTFTPRRDFRLTVQNPGATAAQLAVEVRAYEFQAVFSTNGPYRYGRRLTRAAGAFRDDVDVSLMALEALPAGATLTFVMRDPAQEVIHHPPIKLTNASVTPGAMNRMNVRLGWTTDPIFYRRFVVQGADDVGRGPWSSLAMVNPAASGTNSWPTNIAGAPRKFFRVEGVPSWVP